MVGFAFEDDGVAFFGAAGDVDVELGFAFDGAGSLALFAFVLGVEDLALAAAGRTLDRLLRQHAWADLSQDLPDALAFAAAAFARFGLLLSSAAFTARAQDLLG